jgi:hypothetical protein
MEVCVKASKHAGARLLILSVSNASLATTSSEWRPDKWHRLLPEGHLAKTHGTHFLVLSKADVHAKRRAVGGAQLVDRMPLKDVAALCAKAATVPDGLACTARPFGMAKDVFGVEVEVRMDASLRDALAAYDPDPKLHHHGIIEDDHVKLGYQVGLNSKQTYGRWAAASYAPVQHGVGTVSTLQRFARQAELAALLFGINLEEPLAAAASGAASALCGVATEICMMPLRAHGVYVSDGKRDRPTIPFFGEDGYRAAFDCEDAAMFGVSEHMLLRDLLVPTTLGDEELRAQLLKGGCSPLAVDNVVRALRLAAAYVPLHVVMSFDGEEMLHVAIIMVSQDHLPNIFGEDDWTRALPRGMAALASKQEAVLEPKLVDACMLLGDKRVKGFPHGLRTRDKRFARAVAHDDETYGTTRVVGIYGARIGVDLETNGVKLQLPQLLERIASMKPGPDWRVFKFKGPGALTLLPGPDLPVHRLAREPVPASRETSGEPRVAWLSRDPAEKGDHTLLLFENLPAARLVFKDKSR